MHYDPENSHSLQVGSHYLQLKSVKSSNFPEMVQRLTHLPSSKKSSKSQEVQSVSSIP